MPLKQAADTEQPLSSRMVAIPKEPPADKAPPIKPVERIGDSLRAARLNRREDLYPIAEYLRIKPAFLVALENSQYDAFPADAYVIGFLRTYATFLGLDGKDAVDRYRYEMAGRRKKPVLSMPQPMTEGRAPSALILVAASLAVLMIYAMWYGVSSANRAEVTVAPPLPSAVQASPSTSDSLVPPNTDSTAISQATPTPVPSSPLSADASVTSSGITSTGIPVSGTPPQPSLSKDSQKMVPAADPLVKTAKDIKNQLPSVVPGTPELVIRATQSSWVMITDDNGKAVYDHVLKPGETYKVPHQAGLSLTTGNGSGIILSLNGIDLPKIAAGSPHVVRNVPLDADKLSALKAE